MEQLKSRQGLEVQQRFPIEWLRSGEKFSEEPTHHYKKAKKKWQTQILLFTGQQYNVNINDLHDRVARKNNLNTKLSVWSMQKTTLRSLKPFGTMYFGLTKVHFGHYQRRYVLRKKGEAFVEKTTLPTEAWRLIHNDLRLRGSWGHRKYCVS